MLTFKVEQLSYCDYLEDEDVRNVILLQVDGIE